MLFSPIKSIQWAEFMELKSASSKFYFVFCFRNTRVMPLRCTHLLGILQFVRVWAFLPFHWRQFTWCIVDSKVRWIKRSRKEVRGWEAEGEWNRGRKEGNQFPLGTFRSNARREKERQVQTEESQICSW